MTATTTPPRRIEYMPLSALTPARRNPKNHDLAAVRASIGRFGYADAAILDERTGLLLGGHGRTDALTAMHADGAPAPSGVTPTDDGAWLVPVQRGWSSADDHEAEALLIALNRAGERGGWDSAALSDVLSDLFAAAPDLVTASGYTAGDLDDLLSSLESTTATEPVYYTPPATDAHYVETDEEEAARAARYANQMPRALKGLAEVILIYTEDDRTEVHTQIKAARAGYADADLKASDIVLRALRTLVTVLETTGDGTADAAALRRAAGLTPASP